MREPLEGKRFSLSRWEVRGGVGRLINICRDGRGGAGEGEERVGHASGHFIRKSKLAFTASVYLCVRVFGTYINVFWAY